jgi:hypothetical protein
MGKEGVWCSGGARGGVGVVGGGPVQADVMDTLSGSGTAPVALLRCPCFNDKGVGLGLES